jgi:amino acid transporter
MNALTIGILNVVVVGVFIWLLRRKNLLSYFSGGRWWLTWLSVATITLMDELTSIFYAPGEAFRFIGQNAIIFIALTSLLMHFSTTRMVEIAEILEHHGIKGGGVYSFSYLVLGPFVSFVAVASIMVDYILTASMSTVSAVENAGSFLSLPHGAKMGIELVVVWSIAGLNIIGIRDNARFTFGVFIVAAIVFVNLVVTGFMKSDGIGTALSSSFASVGAGVTGSGIGHGFLFMITGVASCVLAYSGIESVIQTAGLVKSWKEIGKAYIFLAVTVGLVTPLVSTLALSSNINFREHETDLITYFATTLNGVPFGVAVGLLASIALIMAVNTAFVASSELLERVAHRYGFNWVIKTNSRHSLYRIHIGNAIFYSIIILLTTGSQSILAEMYALGLMASFCINMGSLLIYRYFQGTKEIRPYNTHRTGTLILFLIFVCCFLYLALHKPYGVVMWASVTLFFILVGFRVAKKRAPEIKEISQTDSPMELVFALADSDSDEYHIYFRRPKEREIQSSPRFSVFISFYSPREGIPPRIGDNHFRFAFPGQTLFGKILAILHMMQYEFPAKKFIVHFGWPMSSWIDRLSIGVMVFSMMKLPKKFPKFKFVIEYTGKEDAQD